MQLAMDGDKCVEQAHVAENTTWKSGQESLEHRSDIVYATFDVQREVRGAHCSGDILVFGSGRVEVVQLVHDAN